jgi:hypothetical protein
MRFQRLVKATPRAYFGFDHIEIFRLSSEPTTINLLTTSLQTLTTSLQTTRIVTQSIFKCDLDSNNACNGVVFQNNTPGLSVQFNASAETGLIAPYTITDISSISNKFSNKNYFF